MSDCIDRQRAIETAKFILDSDCELKALSIYRMLKELPSAERTGHWILDETDNSITCDKCGCLIWANDISNGEAYYCPNCGAKMATKGPD